MAVLIVFKIKGSKEKEKNSLSLGTEWRKDILKLDQIHQKDANVTCLNIINNKGQKS